MRMSCLMTSLVKHPAVQHQLCAGGPQDHTRPLCLRLSHLVESSFSNEENEQMNTNTTSYNNDVM